MFGKSKELKEFEEYKEKQKKELISKLKEEVKEHPYLIRHVVNKDGDKSFLVKRRYVRNYISNVYIDEATLSCYSTLAKAKAAVAHVKKKDILL